MTLYVAGARMVHYYPVSIPYHGTAMNITVQSYAGFLDLGITACRRVLSQAESHELVEHLKTALREIEALPAVADIPGSEVSVLTPNEPSSTSVKKKASAGAQPLTH